MSTPTPLPRYLQRLIDAQQYPVLVVLEGKHDRAYYLVESSDHLLVTCCEILRRRVEDERYLEKPGKIYGLQEGELPEERMAALPAPYQAQARAVAAHNRLLREDHAAALAQWQHVTQALERQDGAAALQVLWDRRDHEYEGIDLVQPQVVLLDGSLAGAKPKPPRRRAPRSS